jgi:hypothetical protein
MATLRHCDGTKEPSGIDPEDTRKGTQMKTLIISLVALAAGILVGTALRPFSVRAQDVRRASIQIEEVQMNGTSAKVLRGSAVLGLSCAADGSGNVHCYVASGN